MRITPARRRGSGGRRCEGADHRLARGQPRRLDPEGRTADVVQPDLVTEPDARRVAAVLAADPDVERGVRLAPLVRCDPHQPADAGNVDRDERVGRNELALLVETDELPDVV